jgi:hypothetical protein
MTMPTSHLLVPISLTALVSTSTAADSGFAALTPVYENLAENLYLGDRMLQPPFTPAHAPAAGVHLHWALPDGLTHGLRAKPGDDIAYPLVPNRWLVVRWAVPGKSGKTRADAWVVESDALSSTPSDRSVSWPVEQAGSYRTQYLGRTVPLDEWTGDSGSEELFLTALGAGDPGFAAVYASSAGVFGLHDPLLDFGDDVTLSYVVLGWYSNPASDPLASLPVDWDERLKDLGWSLGEPLVGAPPTATLAHGTIHGVEWKGPDAPFESGVPAGEVQVTIGNTSIEAIAALVAKAVDTPDAEELLNALQYGLLEQLDGLDGAMTLDEEEHTREFGGADGGSIWTIRPDPTASGTDRLAASRVLPPGPTSQSLTDLNDAEIAAYTAELDLLGLQTALYQTWYQKVAAESAYEPSPTPAELTALITGTLIPLVEQAKEASEQAYVAVDKHRTALEAELHGTGLVLQRQAMPRYWRPNNPVLLLSGPGVERSFVHGADGRHSADGTLVCRAPAGDGQTVQSVVVSPPGTSTTFPVLADDLRPLFEALPASPLVPPELPLVLWEAILLDPGFAPAIAETAYAMAKTTPTPAQLAQLTDAIAAAQTSLGGGPLAGLGGQLPSPVAVTPWEQPWTPLFLQWGVEFYPSAQSVTDALHDWSLDGVDFAWKGGNPRRTTPTSVQGSIVVNPLASVNLAAPIEQFVRQYPKDPNDPGLEKLAAAARNLNVVSQALAGFDRALTEQKQTLQFPVVDVNDSPLGERVGKLTGPGSQITPYPDQPQFLPIRAGHLALTDLWMVDAYGQVQQISSYGRPATPIVSEALATAGVPTLAELKPRIVQPSRLRFRWASATAEGVVVSQGDDATTSPIAGWLLVNHLDDSLMVYDAAGAGLGELQLIDGSLSAGGPGIRWVQAPGTTQALGAPPSLPNAHLQRFVSQIVDLGQAGHASLATLMAVLDDALGFVNPLGAAQDGNLPFMVGRPVALATAAVRIDLMGPPAYATNPAGLTQLVQTQQFPTHDLAAVPFDVVLGHTPNLTDGLVGFFAGEDYTKLILAQASVPPPPRQSYAVASEPVSMTASASAADVVVSLLVDPRASVHATSGILPAKAISLPPKLVSSALAAMHVTFQTGPLVTDSASVSFPLPDVPGGVWSWLEHDDPATWVETSTIGAVQTKAVLDPSPTQLRDGWLKLAGFAKEGQ